MPQYRLDAQQLDHYRTEGYVIVERLFTSNEFVRVDATIRQMTDQALSSGNFKDVLELEPDLVDGRRVPRRIFNPFDQHATFCELATDPRMLDRVESLIGPDINLQHSKLNMKPARVGSVVDWHQ